MNVNDSSFDRWMAEHKTMLIKGQDNAKLSTLREVHILGKQGKRSSVAIGHVRYINILTWLRGFQVKHSYLVSKSLMVIEGQKKLEKFAILTRKPRSHAWILIYRTWPIGVLKFESAERRSILYRSNNISMSHAFTRSYQARYYRGKCETYSHKLAFYPTL